MRKQVWRWGLLLLAGLLSACGRGPTPTAAPARATASPQAIATPTAPPVATATATGGKPLFRSSPMPYFTVAPEPSAGLRLWSPAFAADARIPAVYTCLGEDRIPPLRWEGAPPGTAAFALIMDDPDAPGRVWDHWVVYDIPATVTAIPEGGPVPGVQGRNSWGVTGYGGPCPPPGPEHRYRFRLYAVDVPTLGLPPGADKAQVLAALEGHILAQAEWTARFGR